jgi:hypothetical protein
MNRCTIIDKLEDEYGIKPESLTEREKAIIGLCTNEFLENEEQALSIVDVEVHDVKITDFIGEKVWFDDAGAGYIWGKEKNDGCQMIGQVRGWGAIQNLFKNKDGSVDFKKAKDFQDGLGAWIADAIQQKLEKERMQ